jgi:hypothetical protein
VLIDAVIQTDGKEIAALKEENDKLRTINLEIGHHCSTLLQELRARDIKINELTAKLRVVSSPPLGSSTSVDELPFPSTIFTPDVICTRQFRLYVSPPRSDEDAIFDLTENRSASTTSDEMAED